MYYKIYHLDPITLNAGGNWINLPTLDTEGAVRMWLSGQCRDASNGNFTNDANPKVRLFTLMDDLDARPCWQSSQSDGLSISIMVDPLIPNQPLQLEVGNVRATSTAKLTAVIFYE